MLKVASARNAIHTNFVFSFCTCLGKVPLRIKKKEYKKIKMLAMLQCCARVRLGFRGNILDNFFLTNGL